MPYCINEAACIACGTCEMLCPVAAIQETCGPSGTCYHITKDCIECGACVEMCPMDIIEYVEPPSPFSRIAQKLKRDS